MRAAPSAEAAPPRALGAEPAPPPVVAGAYPPDKAPAEKKKPKRLAKSGSSTAPREKRSEAKKR